MHETDPYDVALVEIVEAVSTVGNLRQFGISWTHDDTRFHRTFDLETARDWFSVIFLDGRFVSNISIWSTFRKASIPTRDADPLTLAQHRQLDTEP